MACVLAHLLLAVFLIDTSASPSSPGADPAAPCRPHWLPLGRRCFAFYPVWSSWSAANSLCSQTGGGLATLHTAEERQFVLRLANTDAPVWLAGYRQQQNGSRFWSDDPPLRSSSYTNRRQEKTGEGGACVEMTPKSGELHSAPCGELRFYICSAPASSTSTVFSSNNKQVESGTVPGVSLLDVAWAYSDVLAEEILHSSSFVRRLRSGRLTERCYSSFMQQEALYLHKVSSTLETLISSLQKANGVRSLLQDTLKQYSSRNQSVLTSPPPQWLCSSLQSFHSVVLEDPVYWLVALSARACLRNFLDRKLLDGPGPPKSGSVGDALYQEWHKDSLKEGAWIDRYTKVIKEHQDQMDAFKAINIFREHMMNQKSLHKAVACEVEEDEEGNHGGGAVL